MKPDNVFLRKIHINAVEKTAKYLTAEAELIEALDEVEKHRAFIRLGYGSLWTYCTEALKLSESVAASFIGVMRKSREVPELKAAIRAGDFSVSKARKIVSVITPENKQTWIELCKTLPCKKLEKEVVLVNPKEVVHEAAKPVQENRIKLTIGVSEELYEKFQRAQDILCQRTQRPLSYEATLEQIVEFFVEKVDPIRKAQRAVAKSQRSSGESGRSRHSEKAVTEKTGQEESKTKIDNYRRPESAHKVAAAKNAIYEADVHKNKEDSSKRLSDSVSNVLFTSTVRRRLKNQTLERESEHQRYSLNSECEAGEGQLFTRTVKLRLTRRSLNREKRSHRKNLPAEVRHKVLLRDGNRCTHINKRGIRCHEKKWLDFHHIQPVSHGGKDNPENVTILCKSHHLQHHEGGRHTETEDMGLKRSKSLAN
ncbi:MAG: hypothetical protein COT74_02930 [Bdellovibrionales bacterium CG10_big_fil_rev_8_21_14_0_10_45_34]|nr:MAG: hypothetical protein COT74_02930 [Bdellovibrionales bacterium CG10_big_fil_rev_8_21_14_0_10_45_34]